MLFSNMSEQKKETVTDTLKTLHADAASLIRNTINVQKVFREAAAMKTKDEVLGYISDAILKASTNGDQIYIPCRRDFIVATLQDINTTLNYEEMKDVVATLNKAGEELHFQLASHQHNPAGCTHHTVEVSCRLK
jgi:hypothetical protein